MTALPKFIVEDGSCVSGANTFALPDDGRAYWPLRMGGEKWDISFTGEKHCDEDICKALFAAMDFMKCFNWKKQARHCKCCKNDLPNPQVCCDCDGCNFVYERLKEAQLIIADAILNGWRPWQSDGLGFGSNVMVDSMSRSGSSMKFSSPVPLSSLKKTKCVTGMAMTSQSLGARLQSILKCYIETEDHSIQFIS